MADDSKTSAMPGSKKADSSPDSQAPARRPVTIRSLKRMVDASEPFACLTAYDALTASLLQKAGVPVLLVGDTAAEVILGLPSTIHAPLDFMITLTAAVKRGAPDCWVIGDMPFMSYQISDEQGVQNAGRFLVEGQADAVKLEVDLSYVSLVGRMARAGIPVIAHMGSKPQHSSRHGGYYSDGRTAEDALRLIEEAVAFEDAGASMLLIEAVPEVVARRVIDSVSIPVIGCGAGNSCHGQIVVTQDLTGMTEWQPPFAQPIAPLAESLHEVASHWIDRVSRRAHGEHPYRMRSGEMERLDRHQDESDR
ncbi:MAG: 3-methyl-2-oxobutanoate hydroxymethyltransferase [Planctomycetes bacterium TMED75]|nr:3-methyl-2-oxobutanoate hydroxymethyltransferase [Planctomycetaceae bacterium]OUU90410.1 MAG: 3-methyl-2-oxobutanoate hydroxymethyltransferase [Planctomycetes bacterium TMED75]